MTQLIIYTQDNGAISIIYPTGELSIEDCVKQSVPAGVPYRIINNDEVPSDRTFRSAWEYTDGVITINFDKAKTVTHDARRFARSAEFAPLDVKATIPSESVAAEAARAAIRTKYVDIQTAIDSAADVETLKTIIEQLK